MTDCKGARGVYFYVEGDMERRALRSHLGIKASKIGINGNRVTMHAIARNLSTDLMRFPDDSRVVIIFDRETRAESSEFLAKELESILSKDFPGMEFCIGVPDRDMEVWMFSDCETVSKHFRRQIGKKVKFEGDIGARLLKNHIGPGRYDKMTDGVLLFSKMKWKDVQKKSPSASSFLIREFIGDCAWLS